MRTYSNNLSNAPYSTCPECGWSGRDWGFKYSNLCKRCHAQNRKKKAGEIRKHNEEIRQLLEYIETNAEMRKLSEMDY